MFCAYMALACSAMQAGRLAKPHTHPERASKRAANDGDPIVRDILLVELGELTVASTNGGLSSNLSALTQPLRWSNALLPYHALDITRVFLVKWPGPQ